MVLLAATVLLGLVASAAAAPANDKIAQRTNLGDQLPVRLAESNVGATSEGFEEIEGWAAGHSIWWEWESPASQWTTVSTCQSAFPTYVGVFEEGPLGDLENITRQPAEVGPTCVERNDEFTFWAVAGHRYEIGADGRADGPVPAPGSPLPAPPHPPTEGVVTLTLEPTPPPPNDLFAAATPLNITPFELWNGRRVYYTALTNYLWSATKDLGEPQIGSLPDGGTVWYSWTPPESAEGFISTCCVNRPQITLFEGSSLGGLSPVAPIEPMPDGMRTKVIGGHHYMIGLAAIEEMGTPTDVGAFEFAIDFDLAPGPGYSLIPPVIGRPTVHPRARTAIFRFSTKTPEATFTCSVDKRPARACLSPFTVRRLKFGKHRFRVRAGNAKGETTSPATARFKLLIPRRHRHRR